MTKQNLHRIFTYLIAIVWLINGLICKVLDFVPRHQQIVGRILGDDYSRPFTIVIGMSEIVMAIWILSRFKSKLNAITQIIVVATMNTMEFLLVPDLLLWREFNSLFALLFIAFVYYNEFILKKKINHQAQL